MSPNKSNTWLPMSPMAIRRPCKAFWAYIGHRRARAGIGNAVQHTYTGTQGGSSWIAVRSPGFRRRAGLHQCFVVSFYESILDTHSLRRTPTNSYCVRESATPPTASPCKPENAETGEPPNGPSKLYTLNPAMPPGAPTPRGAHLARQTWAVPARANACASRPRAPLRWPKSTLDCNTDANSTAPRASCVLPLSAGSRSRHESKQA